MRQIMTILWDSYRMLKARVLFWVVLAVSVLVAMTFASIGVDENGFSMLFGVWAFESELINTKTGYAELFYLTVFTNIIVTWWLGWLAIGLGLISCSSVFPEFLAAGSVDVAISKPMSRAKLFVVKYLGSLLFVLLQVAVFCVIIFLTLGLRIGEWNWSIFWAVPILVFVFSLIYCVGVLVAVLTRSTMLSLLSMLLIWGLSLLVQWGENVFYDLGYSAAEAGVSVNMSTGEIREGEEGDYEMWRKAHRATKIAAWPLPKTREMTLMIKQKIKSGSNKKSLAGMSLIAFADEEMLKGSGLNIEKKAANRHSLTYVLGSSILFELVILSLACWRFSTKDY